MLNNSRFQFCFSNQILSILLLGCGEPFIAINFFLLIHFIISSFVHSYTLALYGNIATIYVFVTKTLFFLFKFGLNIIFSPPLYSLEKIFHLITFQDAAIFVIVVSSKDLFPHLLHTSFSNALCSLTKSVYCLYQEVNVLLCLSKKD